MLDVCYTGPLNMKAGTLDHLLPYLDRQNKKKWCSLKSGQVYKYISSYPNSDITLKVIT